MSRTYSAPVATPEPGTILTPRRLEGSVGLIVHTELPQGWPDGSFLISRAWLETMADRPPGRAYYFEFVSDDGTVVAITGYLIDDPDCYESFNLYDLMWRDPPVFPDQPPRPTRPGGRALWFPSLTLVQPGYNCAIASTGTSNAEPVTELLAAVVDWAIGVGAASVAVLYAENETLAAALSANPEWYRIAGTVRSQLDIPVGGMEAYLARLSHNHRKQIQTDLRKLAGASARTKVLPGSAAGEEELRLRMNLIEKYGGYSTIDAEGQRLERLQSVFPGDRLWLFRSHSGDSEPLCFSLFIRHGDEWHSFWCGSAYRDPRSRSMYFDCMFYTPIRAAVGARIALIDYGIGYERSKLARGCHAESRDIWVASLRGELAAAVQFAAVRDNTRHG